MHRVTRPMLLPLLLLPVLAESPRPRARDLGLAPGVFPPGPLDAITDVAGVRVGQVTLIEGDDVRTGVRPSSRTGTISIRTKSRAPCSSGMRLESLRARRRCGSW